MKVSVALTAVAAGSLIGCASIAQTPAPAVMSDAKPLLLGALPCNSAQTNKCKIELKVRLNKNGRCVIKNDDEVNLDISSNNPVRVVWQLTTLNTNKWNFQFCPASGDGAFLKDPEDDALADDKRQMSDMAPATDENGTPVADPKPHRCQAFFKWENKNKSPAADPDDPRFHYELRFRDTKGGTVCTFDPWIKNG